MECRSVGWDMALHNSGPLNLLEHLVPREQQIASVFDKKVVLFFGSRADDL